MVKQEEKNTDKLTEKAFSRLVLTSVLGILLCIACLCSATWAWFSANTASTNNKLEAGNFDLDISVTVAAVTVDEEAPTTLDVIVGADDIKLCTLGAAGDYVITLTMTEDTTVTKGHCAITVSGGSYTTTYVDVNNKTLTFTLKAQEDNMTVSFEPIWGMPAYCNVEQGGTLTVGTPQVNNK